MADLTAHKETDGPAAMDALGLISVFIPAGSLVAYMFMSYNLTTPAAKVMVYVQ